MLTNRLSASRRIFITVMRVLLVLAGVAVLFSMKKKNDRA